MSQGAAIVPVSSARGRTLIILASPALPRPQAPIHRVERRLDVHQSFERRRRSPGCCRERPCSELAGGGDKGRRGVRREVTRKRVRMGLPRIRHPRDLCAQGGADDKRSDLPSHCHPFPSLTLIGCTATISRVERRRHASRHSLGHREAPLLAWRVVRIDDAGLSEHVPVAIEAYPDENLRQWRRCVAERVPREPRAHC